MEEIEKLRPNKLKANSNLKNKSAAFSFRQCVSKADADVIVELAEQAHVESRFSRIAYSEDKVRRLFLRALKDHKRSAIFLGERRGSPVGFAYCTIGEYHIGTGTLIATIHNINVIKSVRSSLDGGRVALGLFRGAETWSKSKGAQEILLHVTSNIELDRAHSLAKRLRYQFIGGSYAKTL